MTIIEQTDEIAERPWIDLKTTYDVEAWIDNYNWELQRHIKNPNAAGYRTCFRLVHNGQIYLHTTQDAILLDVTPEAEWVMPTMISAATGIAAPPSQIWVLPEDKLTQLIMGLSSLIASSSIVISHSYKAKK